VMTTLSLSIFSFNFDYCWVERIHLMMGRSHQQRIAMNRRICHCIHYRIGGTRCLSSKTRRMDGELGE
jgi:hypothetical protein